MTRSVKSQEKISFSIFLLFFNIGLPPIFGVSTDVTFLLGQNDDGYPFCGCLIQPQFEKFQEGDFASSDYTSPKDRIRYSTLIQNKSLQEKGKVHEQGKTDIEVSVFIGRTEYRDPFCGIMIQQDYPIRPISRRFFPRKLKTFKQIFKKSNLNMTPIDQKMDKLKQAYTNDSKSLTIIKRGGDKTQQLEEPKVERSVNTTFTTAKITKANPFTTSSSISKPIESPLEFSLSSDKDGGYPKTILQNLKKSRESSPSISTATAFEDGPTTWIMPHERDRQQLSIGVVPSPPVIPPSNMSSPKIVYIFTSVVLVASVIFSRQIKEFAFKSLSFFKTTFLKNKSEQTNDVDFIKPELINFDKPELLQNFKSDKDQKIIDQEDKLIDQDQKVIDQEDKLIDQDQKLIDQEDKLIDDKLIDQDQKLIDQDQKLIDQDDK